MKFSDKAFKHIFIEFDNALYLWDDSLERPLETNYEHQLSVLSMKEVPIDNRFQKENINKLLIEYLKEQKRCYADTQIHLLTHARFSYEAELKFNFINSFYPYTLNDFIGCQSVEDKIMLLELYNQMGCEKSELLVIDSTFEVIESARTKRYEVQNPQYIMSFTHNKLLKEVTQDKNVDKNVLKVANTYMDNSAATVTGFKPV